MSRKDNTGVTFHHKTPPARIAQVFWLAVARSDYHVSTLKEFAQALGGKLVVKMVFPDAIERELKLDV